MNDINTTTNSKSLALQFSKLYAEKNFNGALDLLLSHKEKITPGLFHYNLGTVYLKKGDLGLARFHLEKAMIVDGATSHIENNLQVIKENLEVSNQNNDVRDFYMSLPNEIFITITLVALLGSTVLILKKVRLSIIIFCTILSLTPFISSKIIHQQIKSAIVLNEATILEGPSSIFDEKGKIPAGIKIFIGKIQDGWAYIYSPSSYTGWIKANNAGIL